MNYIAPGSFIQGEKVIVINPKLRTYGRIGRIYSSFSTNGAYVSFNPTHNHPTGWAGYLSAYNFTKYVENDYFEF